MISPQNFIKQFRNSSLQECIDERDRIIKEMKDFEKDPVYKDDLVPSALTRYLVAVDYLKELSELISRKICQNDPDYEKDELSKIEIRRVSITDTGAQAIVNAANSSLQEGSGVCGAIFAKAGASRLQEECDSIGHCDTGKAVLTSGYNLCEYIIHAVGPIYKDGRSNEAKLLYDCYINSLNIAKEKGIKSIAFPLISSGIYGYPKKEAFKKALEACDDWISKNHDHKVKIIFAILDDKTVSLGRKIAEELDIRISD